jgi:uncharacterized protein (PEP-CTERM system associated)
LRHVPSQRGGVCRKAAYILGLSAIGAGLAAFVLPPDAHAQSAGLLPSDAANVNLGDLRQRYESVLSTEPPATEPGFTVHPAISVSGFFADPVAPNTGTNAANRSDFGTIISPSILINAQTSRLQGTLFYNPQATLYAHEGSANGIAQFFNGNLHAILVPDTFFVDARATGAMTSGEGGFGSSTANGLSRSQMTQSYAFQISPLLQHRFDGYGTAEIGYTLAETIFDNGNNVATSTPFGTTAPNQNETTNAAHIGFGVCASVAWSRGSRARGAASGHRIAMSRTPMLVTE